MPGLTEHRCAQSDSEYSSRCEGRSGLGPTRLMSPRRTLTSCGNSSRLVRRMTRADAGDPRVLGCREVGPDRRCVGHHAAELQHLKLGTVPSDAPLTKTGPGIRCRRRQRGRRRRERATTARVPQHQRSRRSPFSYAARRSFDLIRPGRVIWRTHGHARSRERRLGTGRSLLGEVEHARSGDSRRSGIARRRRPSADSCRRHRRR